MSSDIEDRARQLDECMCEVIRREGRPEAQRRARREAIVCALRDAVLAEREACAARLEALLDAIREAAVAAGICRPDIERLSGPQAIMLCADLGERARRANAKDWA